MKYYLIILFYYFTPMISGSILLVSGESQKITTSINASCAEPLTWRIGRIDSGFEIDKKTMKSIMAEVGNLWSEAAGKELITYSDSGQVAINLIYSDKQKFTEDEQKLSRKITTMKLNYYSKKIDYQKLSDEYQEKFKKYNETVKSYQETTNQYKRILSRWSDTNAIPREQNEKLRSLEKRKEFLEHEKEIELDELNALIKKMKQLSSHLNWEADRVNELIFNYKERFTSTKTFHQGFYIQAGDKKKINIYQFENINKLRLVLAHEVGHALGLSHVGNPKSIMYYLMEGQNELNLKLSDEDIQAIGKKCREE